MDAPRPADRDRYTAQESPFAGDYGSIRLTGATYHVEFREADGSIAYIRDVAADVNVSAGNTTLWSAMLDSDDPMVTGVFSAYNEQPLSEDDHYLIEVVHPDEILVFQPVGGDTPLSILAPEWSTIGVSAYRCDGSLIAPVESDFDDTELLFTYAAAVEGEQVGYYRIVPR
jgi:hypothetical protein